MLVTVRMLAGLDMSTIRTISVFVSFFWKKKSVTLALSWLASFSSFFFFFFYLPQDEWLELKSHICMLTCTQRVHTHTLTCKELILFRCCTLFGWKGSSIRIGVTVNLLTAEEFVTVQIDRRLPMVRLH
jgi:hypothetical protein